MWWQWLSARCGICGACGASEWGWPCWEAPANRRRTPLSCEVVELHLHLHQLQRSVTIASPTWHWSQHLVDSSPPRFTSIRILPLFSTDDDWRFLPFYNYPQSRSFLHLQSNLDAICRNLFLIFVNFHCLLYLTVASHNHVVISNFT